MAAHGFALGVDLGTSNTVAVVRWPDGRTRPLLFDGLPIMPSGGYLDETGRLHVGRDAQRLAEAEPARYEPNPKRRIDEQAVLLGGREVPTVELLAAVLRAVAQAAVEAVGFLPPAVLTHPAGWGARRRAVLAAAASQAGWPPPHLVAEPVAAARYFADVLRRPVPVGAALAVFDFGGGTLDIAVVRNEGPGPDGHSRFAVLGSGGLTELGGLDLDAVIVDHLGRLLERSVPHAWHRIAHPQTPTDRRGRRRFWDDVRAAKEMLSRTARAPVAVPGVDQAVHLTREELEQLVAPLVRRGVRETAAVVAACRLAPEQLAGLFLVGGSSRVPLVARLLHAELGVAPTVLEQPELPVAEGAVAELGRPPGPSAVPSTAAAAVAAAAAAPMSLAPASLASPMPPGPLMPGPLAPTSPAPPAFGAPNAAASARVPAPPAAPVSPPGTLDPTPTSPAPTSPAAAPPAWPGGAPRPGAASVPWYRRTVAWVAAATALVVLAAAGAAWFLLRDRYPEVKFQSVEEYVTVPMGEGASTSSGAFTALLGDRAYLAWQRDDTLQVVAVDLANGTELWRKDVPGASERWAGITALPSGVVVRADHYSSDEPRTMYVLHPDSGDLRWKRDFHGGDSRFYLRDAVVLAEEHSSRLVGLDPASGDQRWDRPYPKDEYGNDDVAVVPVISPEALAAPAWPTGETLGADPQERRIVLVGHDRTARVYDARSGSPLGNRDNVGDPDDIYLAHGDQLYVATKDAGYRIDAYDLRKMGEPRAVYTVADPRRRLLSLAPCGTDRICALDQAGSDDKSVELVTINTADGGEAPRQKAPAGERVVAVGDRALVSSQDSAAVVRIFDPAGKELVNREGSGVRVNAGSVLVFADQPATYPQDVNLTGLGAQTGTRTELGVLKDVRSAACAWNESLIACPQETTFVIWRFAQP